MTNHKPSYTERNQAFINEIQSHPNIHGVKKLSRSLWTLHTEEGDKTVYLHYYKWFKENGGRPGYFQASWNQTQNAARPLFHVFLGPSEDSVRIVPNEVLMGDRFTLIRDHDDGKKWRLNVNTGQNNIILDEFDDRGILFE